MQDENILYAISVITGEVFTIQPDDIKLLFEYQIPLKHKPNDSCHKCYGRGYVSRDVKTGLHYLCPCLKKHICDEYFNKKT